MNYAKGAHVPINNSNETPGVIKPKRTKTHKVKRLPVEERKG